MHTPKQLAAALAVAATLAAAAPAAAAAATPPAASNVDPVPSLPPRSQTCLRGVIDPGAFGPAGSYGPLGGTNGPLFGSAYTFGSTASWGGLIAHIVRGGPLSGCVQGNLRTSGS